jgi:hypothetical protein
MSSRIFVVTSATRYRDGAPEPSAAGVNEARTPALQGIVQFVTGDTTVP